MPEKQLSSEDQATTTKALALHDALRSINPLDLPVKSRDRHIPRKEQAKLARELFKELGLKGVSVRAPNYSMARTVEVSLPRRLDYEHDGLGFIVAGCAASRANHEAERRVDALLLAAFPQHDDRSDTYSDYFDNKWMVS